MEETVMLSLPLTRLQAIIKDAVCQSLKEVEKPNYEPDQRITRKQLRELYAVSYPTIHDHMKKGLPFEKIGRKTVFKRSEVDQFFSNKKA